MASEKKQNRFELTLAANDLQATLDGEPWEPSRAEGRLLLLLAISPDGSLPTQKVGELLPQQSFEIYNSRVPECGLIKKKAHTKYKKNRQGSPNSDSEPQGHYHLSDQVQSHVMTLLGSKPKPPKWQNIGLANCTTLKDWLTHFPEAARNYIRDQVRKAIAIRESTKPTDLLKPTIYFPKSRNELLDQLVQKMQSGRSVWLSGPAGIGKSEVARQVVRQLDHEGFEVHTLDLRAITNLQGLLTQIARKLAVGIVNDSQELRDSIIRAFESAETQIVLLLDQLTMAPDGDLVQFLTDAAATGASIICTSNAEGGPASFEKTTPRQLEWEETRELFLHFWSVLKPGIQPDIAILKVLETQIPRQPGYIKWYAWAASSFGNLKVLDMANNLRPFGHDGVQLPNPTDLLQATWPALSPNMQEIFATCCVAPESVPWQFLSLDSNSAAETVQAVGFLSHAGLVRREAGGKYGSVAMFGQIAAGVIADHLENAKKQFAKNVLAFLESKHPQNPSRSGFHEFYSEIAANELSIQKAVEFAVDHEFDVALKILHLTSEYWWERGLYLWGLEVIDRMTNHQDWKTDSFTKSKCEILRLRALLFLASDQRVKAKTAAEQALGLASNPEAQTLRPASLHALARTLQRGDQHEVCKARQLFNAAAKEGRDLGDDLTVARTLHRRASLYWQSGVTARAKKLLDAAAKWFEKVNDMAALAAVLNELCIVERRLGKIEEARRAGKRAAELAEKLGIPPIQSLALSNLAQVEIELGDAQLAEELLGQAAAAADRSGTTLNSRFVALRKCYVALLRREYAEARTRLAEADFEDVHGRIEVTQIRTVLDILEGRVELSEADTRIRIALRTAFTRKNYRELAVTLRVLAELHAVHGYADVARILGAASGLQRRLRIGPFFFDSILGRDRIDAALHRIGKRNWVSEFEEGQNMKPRDINELWGEQGEL